MGRLVLAWLCSMPLLSAAPPARADGGAPSLHRPRTRTCCALATHLPLHLSAAHVPITIGLVASVDTLGAHSYGPAGALRETNGLVYTQRGGFVDTGHTRDYADLTAHLKTKLEPLLARGEGTLSLPPMGGEVRVRVRSKGAGDVTQASAVLAQRIAFELSIWAEILQYYGHSLSRGVDEIYSAFTPEDVYSNLLGTYVGVAAVTSDLPYNQAVDLVLKDTLRVLGAVPSSDTRRILASLAGVWWQKEVAWPSPGLAIKRSFDIGPRIAPVLAPDTAPPDVIVLEVPETDVDYAIEIVPSRADIPRWGDSGGARMVTQADLPDLVAGVKRSVGAGKSSLALISEDVHEHGGPLAHYLVGIRFADLELRGALETAPSGGSHGAAGGSVVGVLGDTRGGDFSLLRFDANHTIERGLIAGVGLFRSDAVYFCRDPETKRLRMPLVSLLGPCSSGEWLGLGGSFAEAFHDGRTGRTAIRPIGGYGVLNLLGNGQSPAYDGFRLLLRAGASFEHVWTQSERARTIPRTSGGLLVLARSPQRAFEVRGAAGYRVDPASPRDAAFESRAGFRWYFVLGGTAPGRQRDGVDPWGVGSLGLESGYSHWTRPLHAFPDGGLPFVATDREGTWQVVLTATLGFEGLTL